MTSSESKQIRKIARAQNTTRKINEAFKQLIKEIS